MTPARYRSSVATAAAGRCATHAGCQRAVTYVADKAMYVAVQMKDGALYVGSAAAAGMAAASDTVGDWVSAFVGEVAGPTLLPGKPGEVIRVAILGLLPSAEDAPSLGIPEWPSEPVKQIAMPVQENNGPAAGMTTENPILEEQGPALFYSNVDHVAENNIIANPGKITVYISETEGSETQCVGITDNIAARAAAHFAQKGIEIDSIPGLHGILEKTPERLSRFLLNSMAWVKMAAC